ncbi:hypothetical protein PS2_027353 [Malus domestica]
MARPQLPHTFLLPDLKEVPKLIYGQAKIKEPAQAREPHHYTNCILGTLSRRAFHGAYHLLKKRRSMGKVNPNMQLKRRVRLPLSVLPPISSGPEPSIVSPGPRQQRAKPNLSCQHLGQADSTLAAPLSSPVAPSRVSPTPTIPAKPIF